MFIRQYNQIHIYNIPSKSLNVYNFGMKMYTSHLANHSYWLRGVHFHAQIVHVQDL